jgi:hypothetical protein
MLWLFGRLKSHHVRKRLGCKVYVRIGVMVLNMDHPKAAVIFLGAESIRPLSLSRGHCIELEFIMAGWIPRLTCQAWIVPYRLGGYHSFVRDSQGQGVYNHIECGHGKHAKVSRRRQR